MRRALLNAITGRELELLLEAGRRTTPGTVPAFSNLASPGAPDFLFDRLIDFPCK